MYFKKLVSCAVSVTLAIFLLPTEGFSDDNSYVAVRGSYGDVPSVDRSAGIYNSRNNYGSAYGLSLAYGQEMNSWLRLEGEFSYMQVDVDSITNNRSQDVPASGEEYFYSLMVNAIADWKNDSDFTPYIGVGIGGVLVNHDVTWTPVLGADMLVADSHEMNFGWQVMAGAAYKIDEIWSVDLMYRYVGVQSRDHTQSNSKPTINMDPTHIHQAVVGLRYNF